MNEDAAKYVTETKYAGQPASVGRGVVVKMGGRVIAGTIDEIHAGSPLVATRVGTPMVYAFHETKTASDVGAMPDGCWSWPPRV